MASTSDVSEQMMMLLRELALLGQQQFTQLALAKEDLLASRAKRSEYAHEAEVRLHRCQELSNLIRHLQQGTRGSS